MSLERGRHKGSCTESPWGYYVGMKGTQGSTGRVWNRGKWHRSPSLAPRFMQMQCFGRLSVCRESIPWCDGCRGGIKETEGLELCGRVGGTGIVWVCWCRTPAQQACTALTTQLQFCFFRDHSGLLEISDFNKIWFSCFSQLKTARTRIRTVFLFSLWYIV